MSLPRLIVVGASGVIGSALMRAAAAAGRQVVGTCLSRPRNGLIAYDMRSAPLKSVIPDLGGNDVVFLLAGYILPSWIFANQAEARKLNLDATMRLVDEVTHAGARLVFLSTNLVFDGEFDGYSETDAPHPLNLYGQMKFDIERRVLAAGERGLVARTGGNVTWDKDTHCPVADCYATIIKPGARMAADNVNSVADVDETGRGLLALAGRALPPEQIYHLASEPPVVRAELAAAIKAASRFGSAMQYDVVPFSALTYTEPRPLRAWLRNTRFAALGVSFGPPFEVIRRKVTLLDHWRETKNG